MSSTEKRGWNVPTYPPSGRVLNRGMQASALIARLDDPNHKPERLAPLVDTSDALDITVLPRLAEVAGRELGERIMAVYAKHMTEEATLID